MLPLLVGLFRLSKSNTLVAMPSGNEPDLPPAAQALVSTLVSASESLSLEDLLERAGVSKRSFQRYRDWLFVLDLLEETDRGYRCPVAFPESEKHQIERWPSTTSQSLLEAVDALLLAELPPDRYGDPDDPLGGLLFEPQAPGDALEDSVVGPWPELLRRFTGTPLLAGQLPPISMGSGPSMRQLSLPTVG